jgi:hypothetical protein
MSTSTKLVVDTERVRFSFGKGKLGTLKPQNYVVEKHDTFEIDFPLNTPIEAKFEWSNKVLVPTGTIVI